MSDSENEEPLKCPIKKCHFCYLRSLFFKVLLLVFEILNQNSSNVLAMQEGD